MPVDRQQQMKLAVAALGVVLVSSQIKPVWRMASAIVGRVYLQILVATTQTKRNQENYSDNDDADCLKVSGLYIHPGT